MKLTPLIAALLAIPFCAQAELALPGHAVKTAQSYAPQGEFVLPVGPYAEGRIESVTATGSVSQQAWRIGTSSQTSLQLINLLADQLSADGYEIMYQCRDVTCGGYDFRYQIQVIGEPYMHVDLGDYRYLTARAPGEAGGYVGLLVSRSPGSGYVQIVKTGPADAVVEDPETIASTKTDPLLMGGAEGRPIGDQLETMGKAVLRNLVFETGSSDLGAGPFSSLAQLAGFLATNPARKVTLVGHTDALGALESNIALSRRRATSVMTRLIERHGVPDGQISARGVGYLAPLTTNLTDEGRTRNRRVEVVLITIQ